MKRKGLSVLDSDLLARIREEEDPEAKETFFARYEDLLHRFAHKYQSDRLPYEDAYQLAALGLMKAVRRFDPERGISFITFAYPTVEGELKRHYRDHVDIVRLPRPLRDLSRRVASESKGLREEGVEPTIAMLASRLRVSEEEVIEALVAQQNSTVFSLDSTGPEGRDDAPLSFFIGSHDSSFEEVEKKVIINKALNRLPGRHRRAMELRLKKGWTQATIAQELGVSQMHVSRLIREAVDILSDMCSGREEIA